MRQSPLYAEIQAVIAGKRRSPSSDRTPRVAGAVAVGDVLVVEDTPVNQLVAARMLEKCGYRPHIAANGLEALEALTRREFAAVLMDSQMPGLDGHKTTREIRRRELGTGRRIPIIAMTAHSMQGERERCLADGMDDYLAKPLRHQTLKDALIRWIAPPAATPPSGNDPGLLDPTVVAELETLEAEELDGILRLYFEQTVAELTDLTGAVIRADAVAVGKAAHRLGSSGRSIGARHISHIASELEATADLGDLTIAEALIAQLRSAIGDTREAFANRVS